MVSVFSAPSTVPFDTGRSPGPALTDTIHVTATGDHSGFTNFVL